MNWVAFILLALVFAMVILKFGAWWYMGTIDRMHVWAECLHCTWRCEEPTSRKEASLHSDEHSHTVKLTVESFYRSQGADEL